MSKSIHQYETLMLLPQDIANVKAGSKVDAKQKILVIDCASML